MIKKVTLDFLVLAGDFTGYLHVGAQETAILTTMNETLSVSIIVYFDGAAKLPPSVTLTGIQYSILKYLLTIMKLAPN